MLMLLRIIMIIIAFPLMLVTQLLIHLVPALFQVFIWLTLPLFTLLAQLTRWQPSRGTLIVLASGLWGGVALIFWPWLSWLLPGLMAAFLLFGVGSLWGLCVGYQAAMQWELDQWRLPDTDPRRQFGLPPHWFGSPDDEPGFPRREEVEEGIILGQTEDPW